jgi:hypothetical protein
MIQKVDEIKKEDQYEKENVSCPCENALFVNAFCRLLVCARRVRESGGRGFFFRWRVGDKGGGPDKRSACRTCSH